MTTIWKLVTTCIIPIITYGSEVWILTAAETKQAQTILQNILKRILMSPISTPNVLINAETGIWDIETHIMKKQIAYYHRAMTENKVNGATRLITRAETNPWVKQVKKMMEKARLQEETLYK